ncbi:MAG: hydrogen gas-evolving membrane-bound hydrogenase subunit E [Phycisphaeraceae bacterium]
MIGLLTGVLLGPCLLGSVAAALMGLPRLRARFRAARAGWLLAAGPAASLGALIALTPGVLDGQPIAASLPWAPSLGIAWAIYLDGLSLLLGMLIAAIATLATLYAGYYFEGDRGAWRFFAYLLGFTAFMLGLVIAGDLVMLFVCWEGTSILSFLLIGYQAASAEARAAALRALLITGGGGVALLAGLLALGAEAGSLAIPDVLAAGDVLRASPIYGLMLALVAVGALTKSAQFPFHAWLPGGMTAPTPASALLHSATMVKAGVYLLARLNPALGFTEAWFWTLTTLGAATMLVAAAAGLYQRDLKGLLAYSTVAQLGVLIMLIGQDTGIAFKALIVGIVAHALYKSALFLLAGIVDHAAHTRDLDRLGGLARRMPWTAGLTILAAASMAGLPPLFGFLAKETLIATATHPTLPALVAWALTGAVVLAGGLIFAQAGTLAIETFFGEPGDPRAAEQAHDPPTRMLLAPAIPAVLSVFVALLDPPGLATLFAAASQAAFGSEVKVSLTLWTGLNLPLMLSGAAVALGLVLLAWRARVRQVLARSRVGTGSDALYRIGLRGIDGAAWLVTRGQNGQLRRYLLVMLLGIGGLLLIAGTPGWPDAWGRAWGIGAQTLLMALALGWTVVSAAMIALLRRDLHAILAYSAAGLGTAGVFLLLPGPDLALVMLVVEVLTVVVLVQALLRMPPEARRQADALRERPGDLVRDGVVAAAAGAVVAVAALGLTATHPRDSRIAPYVLANAKAEVGAADAVGSIIIDYRATDTLVEIAVFALACLGAMTLIQYASPAAGDPEAEARGEAQRALLRTPMMQLLALAVLPFALVLAATHVMFGHGQPGDGFTAGVIAALAAGFWLAVMGRGRGPMALRWLRPVALMAGGLALVLSAAVSAWGLAGSFFAHVDFGRRLGIPLPEGFALSTSLLFELAIALVVLGAAAMLLATLSPERERLRRRPAGKEAGG